MFKNTKQILLYLLLIISQFVYSQKLNTTKVISCTDSILKSKIGDRLFKYFNISDGSYYTYYDLNKKESSAHFVYKKHLENSPTIIKVVYKFEYKDIEGVRGGIWINLDSNLHLLSDTMNFDFIPDFIKENKASNFISIDSAITVADKYFKLNKGEHSKVYLCYNSLKHKYYYSAQAEIFLLKINSSNDNGEIAIVDIDPISGACSNYQIATIFDY